MESNDIKPSAQSITRHLVTFTVYRTKYAPTEQHTILVEGDMVEWYDRMNQDPTITRVVIDFALYLW